MSDCDKNEVYPSKLAKMSEFRHIFSQATLWVDIAIAFIISLLAYISDVPTLRSTFRVAYQLYPVMLRSVSPKVATPMRAPRP